MDFINWVCGFIAHWWGVLDNNSSQIQIVIALIALWFAGKAYKGLLRQLKDSQDQKAFDLKVKIIEAIHASVRRHTDNVLDFYKYAEDFRFEALKLEKYQNERINDSLRSLDLQIKEAIKATENYDEKNNKLLEYSDKLNNSSIEDIKGLEEVWIAIVGLISCDVVLDNKLKKIELMAIKLTKAPPSN